MSSFHLYFFQIFFLYLFISCNKPAGLPNHSQSPKMERFFRTTSPGSHRLPIGWDRWGHSRCPCRAALRRWLPPGGGEAPGLLGRRRRLAVQRRRWAVEKKSGGQKDFMGIEWNWFPENMGLEYSMGLKVVEWDFIQCCLVGFRLVYQDLQPSIYVICGFEVVWTWGIMYTNLEWWERDVQRRPSISGVLHFQTNLNVASCGHGMLCNILADRTILSIGPRGSVVQSSNLL